MANTTTVTTAMRQCAMAMAADAREIARAHFRGALTSEQKDDRTPVTAADRAIERRWRERLAATFPAHGVFGEEEGPDRIDAEWVWVLDPIDGTKAFASGNPLFGSLIGLMHRGAPVLGVLEVPALGERWIGVRGGIAERDGVRLAVRAPRPLERAVLYCTTPDQLAAMPGFAELRRCVQWTSYGGDCVAYAFVAAGTADLVVDRGLKPYDWCALVPILEAAGGVLLDWNLKPLTLDADGTALAASNRELASMARAVLLG